VSAFRRTVKPNSSRSGITGSSARRTKSLLPASRRVPPPAPRPPCDHVDVLLICICASIPDPKQAPSCCQEAFACEQAL